MLGKGFSRFQLVATVVGLAVLTGALAPTVSHLIFLGSTAQVDNCLISSEAADIKG